MSLLEILGFSLLESILILSALILTSMSVRLFYVWYTRIRPRKPSTISDWNTDCEFQSSAIIEEHHITFSKVRNFNWRTTRDRDEDWDENVKFDLREIKDVWFIVDHLSLIHI